ncbi:MAG: hypothetical protein WA858_06175 [Xanthobacteraceae bacterium]|jgi:hypothetical protein
MSHSLTRALPGFASANELEEITANGHADGRFVAHFRRTQSLAPRRRLNDEGTRGTRMQDVTVKSAKKTANQRKPRKSADEQIALRYRQIGISAVAAAARYQGDAKNTSCAPATVKLDERGAAVA